MKPNSDHLNDRKAAEIVETQVEHLITSKALSSPLKLQTSEWLNAIDLVLHSRIAAAGLNEGQKSAALGKYLSDYISKRSRSDAKPLTVKKWNTTNKLLTEFYGESRDIRTITTGDAKDFRLHLMAQRKKDNTPKYKPSTLGKHIEIVKQFFAAATDDDVVAKNVFSGVKSSKITDSSRAHFISADDIQKCIKAAPDWQWRTIIALCRYGGLRCPSEILLLKWDDILWDEDRFIVHSPKTEHHQAKDKRVVRLFPELRKELDAAFAITGGVPGPMITRYRDAGANLRTTFGKIIDRAGLRRWPKLFQNLRTSRQTELEESFATHVVCNWMGNSPKVAREHDLQTTEDHFKKATQLSAALARHASHAGAFDPEKSGHQQKRGWKLAEVGLEPASKNTGVRSTAVDGGNPGGNFQSILPTCCTRNTDSQPMTW